METAWELELAKFLTDLMAVQEETLKVLNRKREMIVAADLVGLSSITSEEESLIERLQACQQRREELLHQAEQAGLPNANLKVLSQSLPKSQRDALDPPMRLAQARMRLLHCESLTNWLVVQKNLLHLAQLLEIIATGGQMQPTYGSGEPSAVHGYLVDGAA